MRIFLIYRPSGNLSVPGSMTWRRNLYEPLVDLGHDVYEFRLDTFVAERNLPVRSKKTKNILSTELLSTVKKEQSREPINLFLSYFIDDDIDPQVIDEIKRLGIHTANFSCNNTHQFYLTKNIAPHFDYNLHSEKDAGAKFKAIGANPVWFQMAANENYFKPLGNNFNYDISFIGARYARRAKYVKHLLDAGQKVDCFGPNWLINRPHQGLKKWYKELKRGTDLLKAMVSFSPAKRMKLSGRVADYDLGFYLRKTYPKAMHYPVSDQEMIKIFNGSRMNLGFLEVITSGKEGSMVQQHLHLREFEVPMCGALYITNYCEELAEHYEPDQEVLVFRNEHELLDKAIYYLSHPGAAEKVRTAGHKRALACHTYKKRFQDLFLHLGLQ